MGKIRKIIIYIIVAFFCMGCYPNKKAVIDTKDFKNIHIDKYAEPIVRPDFMATIEEVEVKSSSDKKPLKEVIVENTEDEEVDEDEQIKQMLKEKFDVWYNKNRSDIKYFISLSIFILFSSVLLLYWSVRLINKIFSNKLGFTVVFVFLAWLLILGIVVYL